MDSNTDANRATMKRKMCEGSQNQPSLQPRRRRKKEEISAEVSNKVVEGLEVVAKPSKMNTSQENKNENFISIFKSIPTLKGGKTKTNRRRASTQKSKITNFFKPIQTRNTGVGAWACVEKFEASTSTLIHAGVEETVISGESGGRECRTGLAKGVGVDNTENGISDFKLQITSTDTQ